MMPISIEVGKLRWLEHGAHAHIVYERDGEFVRTVCGEILRGGHVRMCSRAAVNGTKCRKCWTRIRAARS